VRLEGLLEGLAVETVIGETAGVEITGVTHDSRAVAPGTLFCCVPGEHVDGHDFARAAVARGAGALLAERPVDAPAPQVVVRSTRAAMGPVASTFHGHPSRHMDVVGVTGTNGKTTTTYLVQAALAADDRPTGVIGTLSGARTTPEAPDLQAQLAELRADGQRAVAMEVSSHALAQHRVDGTWFSVAVFTNLTRDHLDFHHSMEEYFDAKARLFDPAFTTRAVIDVDDEHGRALRDRVGGRVHVTSYALSDAEGLEVGASESRFTWRGAPVRLPIGGRFNVRNALAAATASSLLGVAPETIARGLSSVAGVAGRFEPVDEGQPFRVVVDYAHTPDALVHVLSAAREVADGRVLLVFGAGGDRDRTKRPEMGDVATRLADAVWLTSDNPRRESPLAIIAEVQSGARPAGASLTVEPDRATAIAAAIDAAAPGDVVVIAGKGHEKTQTTGETVVPFDDRDVAAAALRARAARESESAGR
jgi:UDP-N-acetylmuramoyl-L-alanyl-D-glutamate--2,6-diaminopimelate ligase